MKVLLFLFYIWDFKKNYIMFFDLITNDYYEETQRNIKKNRIHF